MPKPDTSVERQNEEFAALAVESLQEGVRRALIEHERRGCLVPGWSNAQIEWVSPGEKLNLYPVSARDSSGALAAEQGAAADTAKRRG